MLSVIVPVYNVEGYLHKCIDSILCQTYSDLELLLIDDGSTDSSGSVCDEYARKDDRVRVIHKENGGVSSTRNLGLDLAKGEWITFVDADDWIEHETYEKIFSQIESIEADICCYDFTMVYPHRTGYLHTPDVSGGKDDYLQRWLRFDLTSLCAMVVRKDIYDDNHLRCPIQNYCEDFSLSVRLLFYANKVSKIDYCGYNYNRLNANSLVNNLNEKAAEEELTVYQGILDFFAEKGVLAQYEEPIAWRILKCTQHLILDSTRHDRFKDVFPSSYSKYIFTVPSYLVNIKIKIMAWLLCHRMGGGNCGVYQCFKNDIKAIMTKNKVAGIMRVKNDGMFIERCIESCIDALDELIVVHNDCTDNSVEEIEKMREKYPNKIRRYEYPHRVMGVGLTQEEYDFVKDLPEGSPYLLSTYCNFALSKVTAPYALKIDADQVYFTDVLKEWCDFIRNCEPQKMTAKVLFGKMFDKYFSLYRLLSLKFNRVLPLLPNWLLRMFYPAYLSYAKYAFSHDKACLSMSGVNVLEAETTMIPMGHQAGNLVSGIPFNGEGDTVMFKIKDSTYFAKMPDYSTRRDSLVEQFVHPYKIMYVGFFWTHIRVMRPSSYMQAMNILKVDPESYITYEEFKKLSYKEIMRRSSKDIFRIFQRMLFAFIYKANKQQLLRSLER